MDEELLTFESNSTWDLVPAPPDASSIIGNKWVYSLKVHSDGSDATASLYSRRHEHGIHVGPKEIESFSYFIFF